MLFGRKGAGDDAGKQQQAAMAHDGAVNGSVQGSATASSAAPSAALTEEEARKRLVAAKQMAAAFGEIVTLLMRSRSDKHYTLGDLEWLVVPAVARGQYALAEAQSKETGAVSPVGGVLWALVSEEVDQRLSDLSTPLRLKPNEWRSGDIPWIVLATGDNRVLAGLIQQLTKGTFKDCAPKMRARGPDGAVSVGQLQIRDKAAAAT